MKINSLILYGSPIKLTRSHQKVSTYPYFIRAESSKLDYTEAFDKAKPMRGEVVLNSVPYEPLPTSILEKL